MRIITVQIAAAIVLLAVWTGSLLAQQPGAADPAKTAALAELNLATEALRKGDEAKAWQLYAQNADAFVRNWAAVDGALTAWIPDQLRKQKRFKEAIALSDTILTKSGNLKPEQVAGIMLTKGDVFRDQENYAAARMEYQGLDRNKTYRDTESGKRARFRLVDIFRITKDYESADGMLERLKDSPDSTIQAEAYYYSARIAFDREAYDEARSFIDEVKKRSPEHFETLFLEAELNLKQDRLQDPELEMGSRVLTTYVVPGRPITMKMQDRNLAVVRGGGGIPVQLRTVKGHDEEVVTLSPSPRDPTLFRGSVSTRLGEPATNNMYIEVTGDDIVSYNLLPSFQKLNDLKYEDKKMVVVADGQITASSADFVTEEERERQMVQAQQAGLPAAGPSGPAYSRESARNTSVVRPGNEIYVQVIDADRDVSGQSDHVFVDVETSSRDTVGAVQLVETNTHSGVFRGKLPTAVAPPKANASDSAPGLDPASAIRTGDSGGWTSGADVKGPKWFEIDLMTVYPLAEAALDLGDARAFKSVMLLGGSDSLTLRPVSDQNAAPETMYGYIDIGRHFGKTQQTAAYLYTEVVSAGDQDVVLKLGSAGGLACWLNGAKIHRVADARLWKPEQDAVNAKLKSGVNAILLKVSQLTGPWGASLTIVDAAGQPLPSMRVCPPSKPGVVLQWHLFNRLTPEDIQVSERINVQNPVRVGDEQFRWIPTNLTPVASLSVESNRVRSVFHQGTGFRRLRWVFDGVPPAGSVTVRKATVTSKFGEAVVPTTRDFSAGATNRSLELGPGDRILVKYSDERNTRGAPRVLTATMMSGFHDAKVSLEYETIGMDSDGKRAIIYDAALRYRPGTTESLVARVVDYDEDTTEARDKVRILVQTTAGRQLWLDTIETGEHSGEFIGILKLGTTNAVDTVQVGSDDTITVSYQDRENSDGRVEKSAVVQPAPETPPELILLQNVVLQDELNTNNSGPIVKTRLPPRGDGTNGEQAVVTSLDTALVFKVIYPAAALSENATFPARLVTEREASAAKAEGREPVAMVVAMRLANSADAEFRAEVPMRTGNPSDYADEAADDAESAKPSKGRDVELRVAWLYVRGDDIVRVSVQAAGSDTVREGLYRLASDAVASFADRKYVKPLSEVYVGDYLYLRVSDRDRDVSDGLDEIRVSIASAAGRVEPAMVETLPHSGLFTCRVKTELAVGGGVASGAETGHVLRVKHGERVRAEYADATSVLSSKPRTVTATAGVYPGADGALATFTKLFADEEIAVRTRLLMAEALFELAKSHRETNQKEMAEKEIAEGKAILEEAILDYPNTTHAPHAEFLLANLAHELEHYEEALGRYNKVLSNWPNSEFAARAQLRKGICLEKMNDNENALDAYVELTYSYPSSPLVSDAVIRLGQYFYRTKKYDVAGRIFANFQARNPEHQLAAKSLFLAGQSYLKGAEERKQEQAGRYDAKANEWLNEAILRFDKLIGAYDDKDLRPEAMYWLADSYMKVKDMKKAYQSLKKLTWDYPESKWAKFARGQLVQNARAFEVFEKEE